MLAEFPEGDVVPLEMLTVFEWRSSGKAAAAKQPSTCLIKLTDKHGVKVEVKEKQLDSRTKGTVLMVGGSQKMQAQYITFGEEKAREWMTQAQGWT